VPLRCPKMVTHVDLQGSAFIRALIPYESFTKLRNHAEGVENCKKLAKDDPDKAVKNADSFIFFVLGEQSISSSEGSQPAV
jgi:hypothetical protein